MKNNKQPFLFTMDKDVANVIKQQGFTLLLETEGKYIFQNDKPIHFDKDDEKLMTKIAYTNMLFG